MKKIIFMIAVLTFASGASAEDSWWNSLLKSVGLGEEVTEQAEGPNVDALLTSLSTNLGVSRAQAQGGFAALMSYAKQNISEDKFTMLAEKIPGLDSVMKYIPTVEKGSESGISGLMDKVASYSESLGELNQLNKQFESLGLNSVMIKGYAEQATKYLDTPEGQEAKKLLADSFLKI
jgi:hypothetical protein